MKQFFRPKSKIHKAFIYAMNFICGGIFMFSLCTLDSESWLPIILCVASGLWLGAYMWANEEPYVYVWDEEDDD